MSDELIETKERKLLGKRDSMQPQTINKVGWHKRVTKVSGPSVGAICKELNGINQDHTIVLKGTLDKLKEYIFPKGLFSS